MSQIDNGTAYPEITSPVASDIILGYRPAGGDPMNRFQAGNLNVGSSQYGGIGSKNKIINGDMRIDQRNSGASQTFTAAAALAYCVDRFYGYCTGANITGQQVVVSGLNRYRFTGAASNTAVGFGQRIESVNAQGLASTTATLQVKLSSSSLTSITWSAYYANTTDAFGTLASPTRTSIATGSFTITSTETLYSVQIAVSAGATTGIEIVFTGGALLAAQTLTIGDIQLEAGAFATTFERRKYTDEFLNCARYFPSIKASNATSPISAGGALSAIAAHAYVQFKVPARITPSGISGASITTPSQIQISGISNTSASATTMSAASTFCAVINLTTAGATASVASIFFNSTSGQINFDGCEL